MEEHVKRINQLIITTEYFNLGLSLILEHVYYHTFSISVLEVLGCVLQIELLNFARDKLLNFSHNSLSQRMLTVLLSQVGEVENQIFIFHCLL